MSRVMEIVRLKKKKDIRDRYMNTGRYLIHIEDMKNNVILECGGTKDFCASMFNFIKPKEKERNK